MTLFENELRAQLKECSVWDSALGLEALWTRAVAWGGRKVRRCCGSEATWAQTARSGHYFNFIKICRQTLSVQIYLCISTCISILLRVFLYVFFRSFFGSFRRVFSCCFSFSPLSLSVSFPLCFPFFFLLLAHNQIKCDFVLNFSQRLCTHFGTAFRVARVAKRGQGAGIWSIKWGRQWWSSTPHRLCELKVRQLKSSYYPAHTETPPSPFFFFCCLPNNLAEFSAYAPHRIAFHKAPEFPWLRLACKVVV